MTCDISKNHTPYSLDSWCHHTTPNLFWQSWPIKSFIFEHFHFQSLLTATNRKSLWIMQEKLSTWPRLIVLFYKWFQTWNAKVPSDNPYPTTSFMKKFISLNHSQVCVGFTWCAWKIVVLMWYLPNIECKIWSINIDYVILNRKCVLQTMICCNNAWMWVLKLFLKLQNQVKAEFLMLGGNREWWSPIPKQAYRKNIQHHWVSLFLKRV